MKIIPITVRNIFRNPANDLLEEIKTRWYIWDTDLLGEIFNKSQDRAKIDALREKVFFLGDALKSMEKSMLLKDEFKRMTPEAKVIAEEQVQSMAEMFTEKLPAYGVNQDILKKGLDSLLKNFKKK